MRFHHIGVATANLEKSVEVYEKLGYSMTPGEVFTDPIQRVRIAFVAREMSPLIEIVTPLDDTSPVSGILKKVRTTPYHTCYEVSDIVAKAQELQESRFRLVVEPVEAVAFQRRRVCFLYHIHVGLIELLDHAAVTTSGSSPTESLSYPFSYSSSTFPDENNGFRN